MVVDVQEIIGHRDETSCKSRPLSSRDRDPLTSWYVVEQHRVRPRTRSFVDLRLPLEPVERRRQLFLEETLHEVGRKRAGGKCCANSKVCVTFPHAQSWSKRALMKRVADIQVTRCPPRPCNFPDTQNRHAEANTAPIFVVRTVGAACGCRPARCRSLSRTNLCTLNQQMMPQHPTSH